MGMRIPREIGGIRTEEKPFTLYGLSYIESFPGKTGKIRREIGIGPINTEGTIEKGLARKIADKHGVRIITANFGGDSEGNPPIPIPLFAVPISEETFKYICIKKGNLEEASEEIKKEFVQVKEKLSKAAAEFERAINKLIDSTLHL